MPDKGTHGLSLYLIINMHEISKSIEVVCIKNMNASEPKMEQNWFEQAGTKRCARIFFVLILSSNKNVLGNRAGGATERWPGPGPKPPDSGAGTTHHW